MAASQPASRPAGAVLREHGVTPERVEAEIVRLCGGGLFGDPDRDALTTVGIDVNAARRDRGVLRPGDPRAGRPGGSSRPGPTQPPPALQGQH